MTILTTNINRRNLKEWMLASGVSMVVHLMVALGFVVVSLWSGGGSTGSGDGGSAAGIVDIDLVSLFPSGGNKVESPGEVAHGVSVGESGNKLDDSNESAEDVSQTLDKAGHIPISAKAEPVHLAENRPFDRVMTPKTNEQVNENEGVDDGEPTVASSDGGSQGTVDATETGIGQSGGEDGALGKGTDREGGDGFFLSLEQYRAMIKRMIRPHWAFSGGGPDGHRRAETRVAFEVMPGGDIRCVRLERVSGNSLMDDAAIAAVKRTGTVRPHPEGINRPYIDMVVVFTPKDLM